MQYIKCINLYIFQTPIFNFSRKDEYSSTHHKNIFSKKRKIKKKKTETFQVIMFSVLSQNL